LITSYNVQYKTDFFIFVSDKQRAKSQFITTDLENFSFD